MKHFVFFLVLIMLVSGCGGPQSSAVDVAVVGADNFPSELAGVWRANNNGWEITLAPNGVITEIVHTIGRVRLEPGKTAEYEMRMDGISTYEPGQWSVIYDADLQELTVKIVLAYFYAEIGSGKVEGSSIDIFTGKIVNNNLWLADWVAMPKYTATIKDQGKIDLSDGSESSTLPIIFEKAQP